MPHSTAIIANFPGERGQISPTAEKWARGRGLSRRTLEALPVASATGVFFPGVNRERPALGFLYRDGWKARSLAEKAFVAGKGSRFDFWNIEAVLAASPADVYITEGEVDAVSLVEAGIDPSSVLSVPHGAKSKADEDPVQSEGFKFVTEALEEGLGRTKRFIWCGDNDGPGLLLRDAMRRLLREARFYFVEWPAGVKDANDMLREHGAAGLERAVRNAKPWPVGGIYRLSELPEPPPLEPWDPGFPEWENKIRLAPATMSIVTGNPGDGKTQLFTQIWFNIVRRYDIKIAVASFETRPRPYIRRTIRSLFTGKLEKEMTLEEKHKADEWIDRHYIFLAHPQGRPTLRWFMDVAEVAVVRHNCRAVLLDPWNRLEHAMGDDTETQYIGNCLREIYDFARELNCHIQIFAHPAKPASEQGKRQHPELYHISGSRHWENMTDQGFSIWRPKKWDKGERCTDAVLFHLKTRFDELGYPCRLALRFDLKTGKYVSTDYEI